MEIVSGTSLKAIFLDNGNWWRFFIHYPSLLRFAILFNVIKMLACKTDLLGYHTYTCPQCRHSIRVPHTCKSRFCSSCGKKATDQWIAKNIEILPKTTWQHITFTLPSEFWPLFWLNRDLMNILPPIAAGIIKNYAASKGILPGIYLAIHTFGRDLKRNFHIHLTTTSGGLSADQSQWVSSLYFHHQTLKNRWKAKVTQCLRQAYNNGQLKLPRKFNHIKNASTFSSWLNAIYQKPWVIHLSKTSNEHKRNIEYLGKYLKRPPIGETRIKKYDGKNVSYLYLDHNTDTVKMMTLPVFDFIKRLITHIHDKHFRAIRYYGFLSNRTRGKLLPFVYQLLQQTVENCQLFLFTWAQLYKRTFHVDPTVCPHCEINMLPSGYLFPSKTNLLSHHKAIALGAI